MAITWADVVIIAPELSAIPSGTQTQILADVAELLAPVQWRTSARLDMASKYYAAHIASQTLAGANGPAGPVTEEHVGPIGQSYATPGNLSDEDLSATTYGRRYLTLRKETVIPFFVI